MRNEQHGRTMICEECGGEDNMKIVPLTEYNEEWLFGLTNVTLLNGVGEVRCLSCGIDNGHSIEKLGPIADLVASTILNAQTQLSGKEVRYLRKAAGMNPRVFSEALGSSVDDVTALQGKERLSAHEARSVRAVIAAALKQPLEFPPDYERLYAQWPAGEFRFTFDGQWRAT